jgi:hypothetical protein
MYDDIRMHYGDAVTSQLFWLAPLSDEILDVVTSKNKSALKMTHYTENYFVSCLLPSSGFQEIYKTKLQLLGYCAELVFIPVTYDGFDASEMPSDKLDCDVRGNKEHGQVTKQTSNPLEAKVTYWYVTSCDDENFMIRKSCIRLKAVKKLWKWIF